MFISGLIGVAFGVIWGIADEVHESKRDKRENELAATILKQSKQIDTLILMTQADEKYIKMIQEARLEEGKQELQNEADKFRKRADRLLNE